MGRRPRLFSGGARRWPVFLYFIPVSFCGILFFLHRRAGRRPCRDAHDIFDIFITFIPGGCSGNAAARHHLQGVLDGIYKNTHILYHQLALWLWARRKHTLYHGFCLLYSIAPLCGGLQRLRAKLLRRQAQHGAGELWGLDISEGQLKNAARHLAENGVEARLVCSPMEEPCGIPEGYFDCVYSIYAIGWSTDLACTFRRLAAYLKPGGTLIFSWNHPLFGRAGCVHMQDGKLVFDKSYFDRGDTQFTMDDGVLYLRNYGISDYVNALADAGFRIERLVEQTDAETLAASGALPASRAETNDFARYSTMYVTLPATAAAK